MLLGCLIFVCWIALVLVIARCAFFGGATR